jgi:Asp-tRNA(Asn)/Glu-tRNA(Gln) amidotransferase A subunit family amidase
VALISGNLIGVAVPSRLYYPVSRNRPLNGLRVAVKDNIHLARVVTGAGSKAYAKVHQMQCMTAKCIQKLLEWGAVIVEKTKVAQSADGDTTTSDWVDFSCP